MLESIDRKALPAGLQQLLQDAGKLLLRVLLSGLMLFHGLDKVVHGVQGIRADLAAKGLPELAAYGVFAGEVVAPILVLLGVFTRPVALLYAGTILFASLLVHAEDYAGLAPTGAWKAEVYAFYVLTACAVALLGAGRFSLRGGRSRWDYRPRA